MTREQAIAIIKNEAECVNRADMCPRDCYNCDLVKPDTEILEAFDMAIQALEKQTPKMVYYSADGYSDGELVYDMAECPNCGNDDFEEDNSAAGASGFALAFGCAAA